MESFLEQVPDKRRGKMNIANSLIYLQKSKNQSGVEPGKWIFYMLHVKSSESNIWPKYFRTGHHQIISQPQCQLEHCSHISSSKLEAEFSTISIIGFWSPLILKSQSVKVIRMIGWFDISQMIAAVQKQNNKKICGFLLHYIIIMKIEEATWYWASLTPACFIGWLNTVNNRCKEQNSSEGQLI